MADGGGGMCTGRVKWPLVRTSVECGVCMCIRELVGGSTEVFTLATEYLQ